MNEKSARKIIQEPWTKDGKRSVQYAKGFLEGLASRDALIKELMEALEIIIDSWTNVSLGAQEIYDCKKVLVKAKEALEKK